MAERILVVEGDPAVQSVLQRLFETIGFTVSLAEDETTALQVFTATAPGVVVLDMDSPGYAGEELCRRIRGTSRVPILALGTANDVVTKVLLLELGADDYMTKPFSPRELVTRVRVALRRAKANEEVQARQSYSFDEVEVNFGNMELLRRGEPVPLTPKEFKMLHFFVSNKERVFSRDELLNRVWGYQNYPTTRTVDTHVLRLRKKLERDPCEPVHFQTVHGVGYRFVG